MTEGGLLYWKVQKIKHAGPVVDYSEIFRPLPDPPKGMEWKKDETTGEWSVLKREDVQEAVSCAANHPSSMKDNNESKIVGTNESKIKREVKETSSSSSSDDNKEVEVEVNYLEHVVLPCDTFQGICLNYKISPTKLRQANNFSGSNLSLAPKKLKIPIDGKNVLKIKTQDQNSKVFKIHSLINEFPDMSNSEARAYLEISDWKLGDARQEAKGDREWESKSLDFTRKRLQNYKIDRDLDVHVGIPIIAPIDNETFHDNSLQELEMRPLL